MTHESASPPYPTPQKLGTQPQAENRPQSPLRHPRHWCVRIHAPGPATALTHFQHAPSRTSAGLRPPATSWKCCRTCGGRRTCERGHGGGRAGRHRVGHGLELARPRGDYEGVLLADGGAFQRLGLWSSWVQLRTVLILSACTLVLLSRAVWVGRARSVADGGAERSRWAVP